MYGILTRLELDEPVQPSISLELETPNDVRSVV